LSYIDREVFATQPNTLSTKNAQNLHYIYFS